VRDDGDVSTLAAWSPAPATSTPGDAAVPKKRSSRRTTGGARPAASARAARGTARPNAPVAGRASRGGVAPVPVEQLRTAPGLRGTVERRSYPLLARLARMPKVAPALLLLGVTMAGLLLEPPLGTACLLLVALFVGWLTYLSWPATRGSARLLRLVLLALIAAGALGPALLP
jgi:hypothetical protein